MPEFKILVPNDRKVGLVTGDGTPATLMMTITPPETEYAIQTYSVPDSLPPRVITIEFEI